MSGAHDLPRIVRAKPFQRLRVVSLELDQVDLGLLDKVGVEVVRKGVDTTEDRQRLLVVDPRPGQRRSR